jgi:hypothetical protein
MISVNSGVKVKIFTISPVAFSPVCGCHNWNLLLGNVAKSSGMAAIFLIQGIHTLFSL